MQIPCIMLESAAWCSRLQLKTVMLALLFIAGIPPGKASTDEFPQNNQQAETTQVAFVVLSSTTREPVIGATVRCDKAVMGAATDAQGKCTLQLKERPGGGFLHRLQESFKANRRYARQTRRDSDD